MLVKFWVVQSTRVIEGAGWGIIDDMPAFELLKIINKIDRDGKSDFEITSELGNVMIWDYRNYRMDCDNYLLKGDAESIRCAYEEYEEYEE